MIDILLYECDKLSERDNKEILLHTVDYIKSSKRLERPLIDHSLLQVYFIIIIIIIIIILILSAFLVSIL